MSSAPASGTVSPANEEWYFAYQVPGKLLEMLRGGNATIGGYEYRLKVLSGGKKVVSRRRVEDEVRHRGGETERRQKG